MDSERNAAIGVRRRNPTEQFRSVLCSSTDQFDGGVVPVMVVKITLAMLCRSSAEVAPQCSRPSR